MKSILRHIAAARHALRISELASRQQQAACVHGLSPAPFTSSNHCLHISAAISASKDDGEQAEEKSKETGTDQENGVNRLPENATALEMRQWADRMLGRSAEQQEDGADVSASPPSEPLGKMEQAQMEQELEADASKEEQFYSQVQEAQEHKAEDDAFREEQSFDRTHVPGSPLGADGDLDVLPEAAAGRPGEGPEQDDLGVSVEFDQEIREAPAAARTVQGLPGVMDTQSQAAPGYSTQVAAGHVVAAEKEAQEEQKWQSFMAEHFGTDVGEMKVAKAPPRRSAQSRIFDIKDPRKALDKLLPEEFRRFDVADRSYIRSQEDQRPEPPRGPLPKRAIVAEKPLVRRPDPVLGYAKLGYGSQDEAAMETMPDTFMARDDYIVKMRKLSAQLRIHPTRSFYPGQSYSPEELVPDTSTAAAWAPPKAVRPKPKRATNAAVRKQADFRNQAFLNNFISEVGKLPPKRTTALQQKTHRHLCRQIKLARQMALLPIDHRLTPAYLAKTAGLGEVPSTREDNPVLSHLLPVHTRTLPPRGAQF